MDAAPPLLPYLTAALPGVGGVLRTSPEDFVVEELPAYEPCGEGEHVYAWIEKRGMTTPAAVGALARATGAAERDAGYAGMKDRDAVTRQWVSIPRVDPAALEGYATDTLRVLRVARHRNKLRTGHLHGNRFVLRVRQVGDLGEALARATAVADVVRREGVPNYYGEQRFGRHDDNATQGLAWLRGERRHPREHFQRKMLASAAQSWLYNVYLSARVARGELGRYIDGEFASRHPSGRPWAIDPAEAQGVYDRLEASGAGPMFGHSLTLPTGRAGELEREVLDGAGLTLEQFKALGDFGEGTRRVVRCVPEGLAVDLDGDALRVSFSLPAGAYATVLLREFQKSADAKGETSSSREHPTDEP